MTDSVKISSVTAAIAAQTVTVTNAYGTSVTLNIRDTSALPMSVNQQDCPLLAPLPTNFVSNMIITRDTYGADAALKTVEYDLIYRFFFAPAEQGVTIFEKYDEMVTAAAAIVLYFSTNTNLNGTTDFLPQTVPVFGPVVDGAGAIFHGCDLTFRVKQYMET